MQNQQMDSTNSIFKVPMAPLPPPSQVETLLFNDILEEKSVALRNNMMDFLQVLPYQKFDIEFTNFLKHIKSMIIEGQRAGANVSRFTNSSQISSLHPRPSTSFHYRPSSGTSMMSSHRYSTFRAPENSFQPVEPLNPFKPPGNNHLQPRVVLPRCIEPSIEASNRSHSLLATVIEVSHNGGLNTNSNHNHEYLQLPELSERPELPPNGYSDVTMNEDELIHNSQHNNDNINNDSNSVESLLDSAGFKIVVGLPENNKSNKNIVNQHNSQLCTVEIVEKFLSKWSVNAKLIKSSKQKSSKVIVLLTGTLLGENRTTIIEKCHDAGIFESRKNCDLIKTTKGLYRLIGNIIGGSPNELYQTCRMLNGIPRNWKKIVNEWCGIEKGTKNKVDHNFSLESPAGPIKPVKSKSVVDGNSSFTRNGTVYGIKNLKIPTQITSGKRKSFEHNEFESKSKHRKFNVQARSLTASTPKRPVKPCIYESPSQILKKKIQHKTTARLTNLTSNVINDSISVTKRRSLTKEQSNEFSKSESPVASLLKNSHKQHDQVSTVSSTASLNTKKQAKRKAANLSNVLNTINNSSEHSTRKTFNNSVTATLNSTESLVKSSVNTTKNSSNNSKKPKAKTPSSKDISTSIVKQVKQEENVAIDMSSSGSKQIRKKNNKGAKESKKQTNLKVPVSTKEKSNEYVIKKKHPPQCSSSSAKQGLFGGLVDDAYISDTDFNMESPGKLSNISRGDKSRSETPPLFNNQWASTSKSLTYSNPPTPLSKSIEAKVLKRIKAPKITLEEELKNERKINKKTSCNYEAVSKKINKLLEFGEDYDE